MRPTKRYACNDCYDHHETVELAQKCCQPVQLWECSSCSSGYGEEELAERCCTPRKWKYEVGQMVNVDWKGVLFVERKLEETAVILDRDFEYDNISYRIEARIKDTKEKEQYWAKEEHVTPVETKTTKAKEEIRGK